MINSRKLEDLIPAVQAKAEAFAAACKADGINVLIYSTLRDNEEQARLYAQGRTAAGNIVTNAKPGRSWHNWGAAFDFVPLKGNTPQWGDTALYLRCGIIAERCGLEWAGRWTGKLRETAHCQYRGGLSLDDLQAGKKIV
jgi:peptidoglycan L-alanyl-D-glutamate endopeptidase CwlK